MELTFSSTSTTKIVPFSDISQAARATVSLLEKPVVALSGGSTFAALFPLWADLKPNVSRTSFVPVDERLVPFEDENSNWRVATKLFLSPLGLESQKSHHPQSARDFQKLLIDLTDTNPPVLDVVMLGVGDDGHTASLFPGDSALNDNTRVVVETSSPKPPVPRLSLAPQSIITAKSVVGFISGEKKKPIVKRIIEQDDSLPIVHILKHVTHATLFIDSQLLD